MEGIIWEGATHKLISDGVFKLKSVHMRFLNDKCKCNKEAA